MRLLVCGGRKFADEALLDMHLLIFHTMHTIDCLIEGGANGADHLARKFAKSQGIPVCTFPAQWAEHGRAAGPKRNETMIRQGKPDVLMAFPGGKGTADMVSRARAAGVEVIEISHA